jgi:hypothetical protein
MPYRQMNTLLDDGYPDGAFNYWLSSFTDGVPDELIDTAVERFAHAPSPMTSILFEHFHGAVTRAPAAETAVPHCAPGWNLFIPSVWTDADATDADIRGTRETFAELRPGLAPRRWLNYLGDDEADNAVPGRLRPQLHAAPRDQAPLRPR